MFRTIFALLGAVFLLIGCSSDHPANGVWENKAGGSLRYLKIEPNGDMSFIVTPYKTSIWDGSMGKREVPGTLEGGDVIVYDNQKVLYKRKADEIVINGTMTLTRMSDGKFKGVVKDLEKKAAERAKNQEAMKACVLEMAEAMQGNRKSMSAKCQKLMGKK